MLSLDFLQVIGVVLTLFGLWQLDWAMWVDKIDAFAEHLDRHFGNLSKVYLAMMVSPIAGIFLEILGVPFAAMGSSVLFQSCLLALVHYKRTAPATFKISLWGDKMLTADNWIALTASYVFLGLTIVSVF